MSEKKITLNEANEIVKSEKGTFDLYTADKHTAELTTKVQAMRGIGEAIKSALVKGINNDFEVIPGTNKPTLLQPGARKVALLFGLIPEYTITEKNINYDVVWKDKKYNSTTKSWYQVEVAGHFEYELTATLKTAQGHTIATGVGYCCNREKGKNEMPANSILKMAKKRAFVDAVLSIADLSSVFTQDMEDIRKPQSVAPASTSGYQKRYG